jgi:hypothetical protein
MTARCALIGTIAPSSQPAAMWVRGVPVVPTRTPIAQLTPLGAAVREACAAVLAGELQPCQWCGSIAPCDCLRWHEYMLLQDADPHGDLSVFSDEDLPY